MLMLALTVLGCQRAQTDYDPKTDFSVYHSFAWEPRQPDVESETERDYPRLMDEVREALAVELEHKGLVRGTPADADLLLGAHVELAPYRTDTQGALTTEDPDLPARKLGPLVLAPYSVTQVDDEEIDRQLQEGTLLLNVTERQSASLLWQGWVRHVVDLGEIRHVEWKRDPDAGQVHYQHRLITRAAKRLLADFPPPPPDRLPALAEPAAAAPAEVAP